MLEFKTISVNPLLAATFPPLIIVSLSSYPGSPNETLLSNQPIETCIPSILISLWPSELIDLAIFKILPLEIKISCLVPWYLLSVFITFADLRIIDMQSSYFIA